MPTLTFSDDARQAFDDHVTTSAAAIGAPAVVAAVVADGEVVHRATGGPSTAEPRVTESSVFRIASMTKSFTAAAVLLLRDRGSVRLDDPVVALVPELASLAPATNDAPAVTIRHLLTMASGLATDDAWADRHLDDSPAQIDALFSAGATAAHPPGITMEYSNLGYAMLGRVIERASGISCTRFVTEELLAPLGLLDTVWELSALSPGADVVPGHRLVDGLVVGEAAPLGNGGFAPMGGLWSTVVDLATWVGFLCDAFPARDDHDEGPLCRATRRELQQVHRAYRAPGLHHGADGQLRQIGLGYGMGLQRAHHLEFGDVVSHSGGLPGYGSHMRWLPHRGVGVIALANLTYAPMSALAQELLELVAAHTTLPEPPLSSPLTAAAADALVALLDAWETARAVELFSDNVLLDEPGERRVAAAEALVARYGRLRLVSVTPMSATEADATVAGDRDGGQFTLSFQLAPTVPPRIQWYEVVERT